MDLARQQNSQGAAVTQPVRKSTPPDLPASHVAASGVAVSEVAYTIGSWQRSIMNLRHAAARS
jgi:hypothetical protein